MQRILRAFDRQGVDALILDLRRNGGGSLKEAIDLTGLFIEHGPVVQVKDSEGTITPYNYRDGEAGTAWKRPMVVLISKLRRSASEILAGAIQDYGRGLIVGDHSTHGKGTVQSLIDLGELLLGFRRANYEALKITMQQFYRPDGDSTQKRGVLADIEWPSLTSHIDKISESDQDYALEFDRVDPQPFQKFNLVTKPIVESLKALSTQRVLASPDFQKVSKDIARYEEQKKRKYVTLNEKKFLEERAEVNSDKEEEKSLEEMADPKNTDIKRDKYLNEAMAISVDYLKMIAPAAPIQAVQNQ